jgi:hypothetical protein
VLPSFFPYNWVVCHAGTWITRNHRYVWVVDHKRHHHPPIHWVKAGHSTGFVPIHPRDVAGKPPLNLKEGIFTITGGKGEALKRIDYNPGVEVRVLESAPKEFLKPYYEPLQRAETPHLETRSVSNIAVAGREGPARSTGTPIAFDHKSQSFVVPVSGGQAGHTPAVAQRFGGTASNGGGGSNYGGNVRQAGNGSSYNAGNARGTASTPSRSSGGSSGSYSGGNSAASHPSSSPAPAPAPSAPSGGGSAASAGGSHK